MTSIDDRDGRIDVLINHPGIEDGTVGAVRITAGTGLAVFAINVVGVIRVTQAALPLLHRSDNPVVVNVISTLGSFWTVTNPEWPQS